MTNYTRYDAFRRLLNQSAADWEGIKVVKRKFTFLTFCQPRPNISQMMSFTVQLSLLGYS